jgi:uncharacterized protein HemX
MKHSSITTLAAALGLALSAGALAQQQPPQPTTPQQAPEAQQVDVGDEEVRKFAEIYVEVEQTRAEIAQELSNAADQQEAQDIQVRAQEEIVTTIEDRGWSVEQFNQVANAINNDPELRQQAVEHIKEMGKT